jgi:hypothetical protein
MAASLPADKLAAVVPHHPNLKGTPMKQVVSAALLAAFISGCASVPDSIKGPFASFKQSVSDIDVQQPESSPFPQETDEGKG